MQAHSVYMCIDPCATLPCKQYGGNGRALHFSTEGLSWFWTSVEKTSFFIKSVRHISNLTSSCHGNWLILSFLAPHDFGPDTANHMDQ